MFEGKTHLSDNALLKLSFGYTNLSSANKYEVKSYTKSSIDGSETFYQISYDVEKTEYEIIPLSIGVQYNIEYGKFTPYIYSDFGYNLIHPTVHKSETSFYGQFNFYNELPVEHRYKDDLPLSSFKLAIGFGINYPLSSVFGLDIRYLNQIDSEIINSQQLLVRISF